MSPPPYLLASVLLFWGWYAGLWWLGAGLALLAELPRLRDWHWELEPKERQRVADLCTLLITLTGIWLYLNQPRLGGALILLIQWLPALVFPLIAVQLYGRHEGLELAVLFLSLRGGRTGGDRSVDLRWGYLLLCVISAAMVRPEQGPFYPSLALLAGWALWALRPPRTRDAGRSPRWLGAFTLAALLGFGLSLGLRWAHGEVEDIVMRWVEYWMGPSLDPYRATTAIGEVGELKGSEQIVLRVYPNHPLARPLLLRTASYDRYIQGTWFSSGSAFTPLARGEDRWLIGSPRPVPGERKTTDGPDGARVVMSVRRREGLLPVPPGTREVRGPHDLELARNGFGTVRFNLHATPPQLGYDLRFAADDLTSPADAVDLRVPPPEQPTMTQMVEELGLGGIAPKQALARLNRFFARRFQYSLALSEAPAGRTALTHFLLEKRSGHCEYFATAAALLLRQAGIPTRYARGWSVQEYSGLEQGYVARDRHAHAWVMVWINGAWRDFDPTPPDWAAFEAAERPWWANAGDLLGHIQFLLSGAGQDDRSDRNWLLFPLVGLIALLIWRVARRARRGFRQRAPAPALTQATGALTPIEHMLAKRGLGRWPNESPREWAARLAHDGEPAATELTSLVDLHYRDRFDPNGLSRTQRNRRDALLALILRHWR